MAKYVPSAGDIIWIDFEPQAGHEQGGHRPAVVLSDASYNGPTGLAVCCPMTTRVKGYPFEVAVPPKGVVLADHVRSVDWRARGAKGKGRVPPAVLAELRDRIAVLIGL